MPAACIKKTDIAETPQKRKIENEESINAEKLKLMHKIAANAERCVSDMDKQMNDDANDPNRAKVNQEDDGRNPQDDHVYASQGSSASDATTLMEAWLSGSPHPKDMDSPYAHVHGISPARAGSQLR